VNISVWRTRGQLADDASHGMDEAHVEHAVGLVEHQQLDLVEAHGLALDMVDQPARRGDQQVDPLAEQLQLRP